MYVSLLWVSSDFGHFQLQTSRDYLRIAQLKQNLLAVSVIEILFLVWVCTNLMQGFIFENQGRETNHPPGLLAESGRRAMVFQ